MNFIGAISFLLGISTVLGMSPNRTVAESEASSKNTILLSSSTAVDINGSNTSLTSAGGTVKSLDQELREAVGVIKDKIATNKGSDGILDSGPVLVAEPESAATASNRQNITTAIAVNKTSQPFKSDNNEIQATRDIIKYRSGVALNNASLSTNDTSTGNTSSKDAVTDAVLVKKTEADITEPVSTEQSKPAAGLTLSTQTRTENTSDITQNETVVSTAKQGRPADNLSNDSITLIENQNKNNTNITAADSNMAITATSAEITSPASSTGRSTSSDLNPKISVISASSSTENVTAESAGLSPLSTEASRSTFSESVTLSTAGSANSTSESVMPAGFSSNITESAMLSTATPVNNSSESTKLSTMASVGSTSGSTVLSAEAPINSASELVTTVGPSCTSPACDNTCRLGYKINANGCPTCECKVHQCQSGRLLTGTNALMCDLATRLCPLGQVCEGIGSGSDGVCCESVFTFSENCPRARPGSRLLCLVQQRYQCSSDADCSPGRSCCPSTCGNSCRRLSRRRSRLLNIVPSLNRL